jgi:hypothetical protein
MLATNLLLAIALLLLYYCLAAAARPLPCYWPLLYYCSALPGGRPSQGSGLQVRRGSELE